MNENVSPRDPVVPNGEDMSRADLVNAMQRLNKYVEDKDVNLTDTFKAAGGSSNGIISKPRFKTALGMAFHHFPLNEPMIAAIALKYGCGPPDSHSGGYQEVLWRSFVVELRMMRKPALPSPPNPFDPRILLYMSEMRHIAEDSGLAMVHGMQGCDAKASGLMSKQKFFTAMTTILFPNYHFGTHALRDIALVYANTKGPPDLRNGGYQEVLWRQFVIDLRRVPLPDDINPNGELPTGEVVGFNDHGMAAMTSSYE